MKKYDYKKAIHDDIMVYLEENWNRLPKRNNGVPWFDEPYSRLVNAVIATNEYADDLTAETCLYGNGDLVREVHRVIEEDNRYGYKVVIGDMFESARTIDTTIRVYLIDLLLSQCLNEYSETHTTSKNQ